jgi:hypothetical protein
MKTITIKDFKDYKFNESKTQRNELNYINTFKSWTNNIFTEHNKDLNFNWFLLSQNEVFLKLFEYRNNNNNSIETLRKDINLLMKLLKLAVGERYEIINKYKIINIKKKRTKLHFESPLAERRHASCVWGWRGSNPRRPAPMEQGIPALTSRLLLACLN